MDHNVSSGFPKASGRDLSDMPSHKQWPNQDRFDSGYDSYNSIQEPDRYTSSNETYSELTKTTSTLTTTSTTKDSTTDITNLDNDQGIDSGLPREDEEEYNHMLQWFLPDKDGDTYLQLAIIQKKVDLAFNLVQACVVPDALDIANENCQTALHLAVMTDQPQIVRCLVAYGANVHCRDQNGNTPLHIACQRGYPVHVDMLTQPITKDENTGFRKDGDLPQNVNDKNFEGYTPLHLASMNNHTSVMELLHNLHCDVDIPDVKSGRTALHHAIDCRRIEATRFLVERCHADVNALTYDECSPLHLAAAKAPTNIAKMLIEHGADIFLITLDDYDVFELATHNRKLLDTLRDEEKKLRISRAAVTATTVGC